MSTCNFHAVERVADVRPDFALPPDATTFTLSVCSTL
jgi:hypothetical protein